MSIAKSPVDVVVLLNTSVDFDVVVDIVFVFVIFVLSAGGLFNEDDDNDDDDKHDDDDSDDDEFNNDARQTDASSSKSAFAPTSASS